MNCRAALENDLSIIRSRKTAKQILDDRCLVLARRIAAGKDGRIGGLFKNLPKSRSVDSAASLSADSRPPLSARIRKSTGLELRCAGFAGILPGRRAYGRNPQTR